jgi:hypothetical protein
VSEFSPNSNPNPKPAVPSIDFLRAAAAQQGVLPEEEDLRGVVGFLEVVLPRLAHLEDRLPPETPA